jgi:DNA mismatch repair protein MutS
VVEYLHDLHNTGVKTLFATHYHELTELAHKKLRVKNYNIAVKEWNEEIIFLRKLVEGGTNRSYGIQVARLAGIPIQVIDRARKILYNIENGERELDDALMQDDIGKISEKNPMQLNLFRKPDKLIVERLNTVDIAKMTPMEAINFLNDLQEMVKSDKK